MTLKPYNEINKWVSDCPKCGEYATRKPVYNAPSPFSEFGPGVDFLGYPCAACGHTFFTRCKDAPTEAEVSA